MRLSDTCVAAGQLTLSVSDSKFAVAVFAVAALSSLFQVSPLSVSGFTTVQSFRSVSQRACIVLGDKSKDQRKILLYLDKRKTL